MNIINYYQLLKHDFNNENDPIIITLGDPNLCETFIDLNLYRYGLSLYNDSAVLKWERVES